MKFSVQVRGFEISQFCFKNDFLVFHIEKVEITLIFGGLSEIWAIISYFCFGIFLKDLLKGEVGIL